MLLVILGEWVVHGKADGACHACAAFASWAAQVFDDDGAVEIVNIFQCREPEMTLR